MSQSEIFQTHLNIDVILVNFAKFRDLLELTLVKLWKWELQSHIISAVLCWRLTLYKGYTIAKFQLPPKTGVFHERLSSVP